MYLNALIELSPLARDVMVLALVIIVGLVVLAGLVWAFDMLRASWEVRSERLELAELLERRAEQERAAGADEAKIAAIRRGIVEERKREMFVVAKGRLRDTHTTASLIELCREHLREPLQKFFYIPLFTVIIAFIAGATAGAAPAMMCAALGGLAWVMASIHQLTALVEGYYNEKMQQRERRVLVSRVRMMHECAAGGLSIADEDVERELIGALSDAQGTERG